MKIVQLTDLHLTRPGETVGGGTRMRIGTAAGPCARAASRCGSPRHHRRPVGRGDSATRGLKGRLAGLSIPARLAIGNHDDRTAFLEVFPELADEDGHVQQVFELSRGTGLILDSWGPDSHAGFYLREALRLAAPALAATDGPAYLFIHHHPIPTHIVPMDRVILRDAEAFGAVVAEHRSKIAHIFFGQCHMPLAGSFHGVPVSAPRGTNHALFADFLEKERLLSSTCPNPMRSSPSRGRPSPC